MTTLTTRMTRSYPAKIEFGLRKPEGSAQPERETSRFDSELWERLQRMQLDDPKVETPISKRLAAEHNWTEAETRRAINEYKRFLYLTQRAGFEVTPSRPVDLVWHEHLMHTEHYWGTLCREVLRNDLHHKPGAGEATDGDRLMSQYRRTLEAYQGAFGYEPPADIWPRPAVCKSGTRHAPFIFASFAGLAAGIGFKIWALAVVCFFFVIVGIVAAAGSNIEKRRNDRGGCGSGCGGGGGGCGGGGD